MENIGGYAFKGCEKITNITIPDSVNNIGYDIFSGCTNLVSVNIGENVTQISDFAFYGCKNLINVGIKGKISSIGDLAFYECENISKIYYNGSKDEWDSISINAANDSLKKANIYFYSTLPEGTLGNTKSTSGSAPFVKSAKMKLNGKTYDLLNDNVILSNTDICSIETEINENGCSDVHLYITQGSDNMIDITPNATSEINMSGFSSGKTIYILAIDNATGKSTSTATNLSINPINIVQNEEGSSGINFKFGSEIEEGSISEDVPVFGGSETTFSPAIIPMSVEYSKELNNSSGYDETCKIIIGIDGSVSDGNIDFNSYKDDIEDCKRDIKNGKNTIHSIREKYKMTKKVGLNTFKNLMESSKKSDSGLEVAGYIELKRINGNWKVSSGGMCISAEYNYTYQGQSFIWVVPVYYEIGGGIGAEFNGAITGFNFESNMPCFEGSFNIKISGEIGAGLGLANVATLGGNGEASLNFETNLSKLNTRAFVQGSANVNVKLLGKIVAKREFLKSTWPIYDTDSGWLLNEGITLQSAQSMYDIDKTKIYENESRKYIENPTKWIDDIDNLQNINTMATSYTNKNLKKLAENIYTESAPQLCNINNKKVLVMQWDNPERTDINRTMLVYSIYDELNNSWSEPVAVDDDGTADFFPCFKDGYLVWQNEKSEISDDMSLEQIASLGEISVAKWNGDGFDSPISITDNVEVDTQPSVSVNENGIVSVVWTRNTENDILGNTGTNSIMKSDFDGEWESPVEIKSNLSAVTNITSGIIKDKLCIAYVTDKDNNLGTIDDRDIYLIYNDKEIQFTDDCKYDGNPVISNNMIYYYNDSNIKYSTINGKEKSVFTTPKNGLTDSFVVNSNDNGDTAIWWTKTQSGCTEIYSVLYTDNEWSDEIQVTDLGYKAKYPSGLLDDDNSMIVAFNCGMVENDEITQTDLYTVSVNPSYDLEILDSHFDEKSMKAYATIKNNGEITINDYKIILNDDNNVNSEKIINEPLKAGETAEVEIVYNKPENMTKKSINLEVALLDGEEYNKENNVKEFEIGHADIDVENIDTNEEQTMVSAEISNVGYSSVNDVKVQLRCGSIDGEILEEKAIKMNDDSVQTVDFSINKDELNFNDSSIQLYITAECEDDEISVANNSKYVYILNPKSLMACDSKILNYKINDDECTVNLIVENNVQNSITGKVYSAIYDSNGKLKGCGIKQVSVASKDDTGVDVVVSGSIESGDVIKTFIWDDNMNPLSKIEELTIK